MDPVTFGVALGLGLAVAHGIIKEHGGRLWAENVESGGAVLMLELPVSLRRTERAAS